MEPEQKLMLESLELWNYLGMVDVIQNAEQVHAEDYKNSRIGDDTDWRTTATFLLAQCSRPVLESILNGTLPERALPNGDLADHIRRPADPDDMRTWDDDAQEWEKSFDPVVYLNWLAGGDGKGLTIPEFERFLDAFEIAAELDEEENTDMRERINSAYKNVVDYRKNSGFYGTFGNASMENYRESVRQILNAYRTRIIPAAKRAGITHLMFKPEVGWSMYNYDRAKNHRRLTAGTPHAMRLAKLVLDIEFPHRNFHFHQFCLFEIVQEEHAAIGESIASQLCASYNIAYGGFNTKQAGISDNETRKAQVKDWQNIMNWAEQVGYLKNTLSNLENLTKYSTALLEQSEKELRDHQMLKEIADMEKEIEQYEAQNTLLRANLAMRTANIESLTREIQTLLNERAAREQHERRMLEPCARFLEALEGLNRTSS